MFYSLNSRKTRLRIYFILSIIFIYLNKNKILKNRKNTENTEQTINQKGSEFMNLIFLGDILRGPLDWEQTGFFNIKDFDTKEIKYLEIGVLFGSSLFQSLYIFLKHPKSTATCIDPWINYEKYTEGYDNNYNYNIFLENLKNFSDKMGKNFMHDDKLKIIREYSETAIPKLCDNYYDIIYIDANHDEPYVYLDAINSFKKAKVGGLIIFDDTQWIGVNNALEKFMKEYDNKIVKICEIRNDEQRIYKKISN